jgi:hypothetical protein
MGILDIELLNDPQINLVIRKVFELLNDPQINLVIRKVLETVR